MSPVSRFVTEVNIEGVIYMFSGSISVLFALFFWLIIKYSFHKGMACSLCVLGLLQLWRGYAMISGLDSFPDPVSMNAQTETNLQHFIYKSGLIRNAAIALLFISVTGFITIKNPLFKFWKGLTLGLLIEAAVIITMETAIASGLC